MKYKLKHQINLNYSATEQVFTNRGIPYSELHHYLSASDKDINDPRLFGEDKLAAALQKIQDMTKSINRTVVVVDADCDGYTSSALLLNYLHDIWPDWVENKVDWRLHTGKQHGLSDHMEYLREKKPSLVIIPDAGKLCA